MRRRDWPRPTVRYRAIGGLQQAVYEWQPSTDIPDETVVLLHGWMDSGRTFAPLVANLSGSRRYIALDWRGFGASERAADGRYLVPDYLADLDSLLNAELGENQTITLIGHSLGGNVAGLYAGIRHERVQALISLEGFGLPDSEPGQAPNRYRSWLDAMQARPERCFGSLLSLARHIRQLNPRLEPAMATYLAGAWGQPDGQGGVMLGADPAHRHPNPVLYRLAETLSCWQQIQAPVLWVYGEASTYAQYLRNQPDWAERLAAIERLTLLSLPGVGHSLTHEAPQRLGKLLEANWPGGEAKSVATSGVS